MEVGCEGRGVVFGFLYEIDRKCKPRFLVIEIVFDERIRLISSFSDFRISRDNVVFSWLAVKICKEFVEKK